MWIKLNRVGTPLVHALHAALEDGGRAFHGVRVNDAVLRADVLLDAVKASYRARRTATTGSVTIEFTWSMVD